MKRHHPKNERIKRAYRIWLQEAKQKAPHSVDGTMGPVACLNISTVHKDFGLFHIEQARKFKRDMMENVSAETGRPLPKATIKARLDALERGFISGLPIRPDTNPRSNIRTANTQHVPPMIPASRQQGAQAAPDLEQIHSVISTVKSENRN